MKQTTNAKNANEYSNKDKEVALLNAQKKQLTAQLRELKSIGHTVFRLIGILRNVDRSITWKIGRSIVSGLSRLSLKKAKPGFIVEVDRIESEFIEFSKSIGIGVQTMNTPNARPQENTQTQVRRRYDNFDRAAESALKSELTNYASKNSELAKVLVSIVMPTHNRAHTIQRAIESVISQTHQSWELIIVDDGSTDSSEAIISPYLSDSRIKYIRIVRSGVGAARNTALRASQGEVISFLDSDNDWYPDYLAIIVAAYGKFGVSVLYSGMELYTRGKTVGFRGDHFNYDACLEGNYVDLNCFSHLRGNYELRLFNPSIKRYNDWDYILNVTKNENVRYLPFVGVRYYINSSEDQISSKEPMIYRQIVRNIHQPKGIDLVEKNSVLEILEDIVISIVIFVSGENKHKPTSDYYAGLSLKHALERLGQRVSLCFFGEPVIENRFDVAISIRGVDYHVPILGAVNVLWSLDSAADTDLAEVSEFDLVFAASDSSRKMLEQVLKRDVNYLPIATDRAYFFKEILASRLSEKKGATNAIFIGNQGDEKIVKSLVDANISLVMFGLDLQASDSGEVGRSFDELNRTEQKEIYINSSAVIFGKPDDFGYINAYVLDAIASGAEVYIENSTEAARLLAGHATLYSDTDELLNAIKTPEVRKNAAHILYEHGFDARASSILNSIRSYIANVPIDINFGLKESNKPIQIALFPQVTKKLKWSSSAYIRLIMPLTSPAISSNVCVTTFGSVEDFKQAEGSEFDIVIVSRTAIPSIAEANSLIDVMSSSSIPLVIDIDDGFHLIDNQHPEFEKYSLANEALSCLQNFASEIWCATNPLAQSIEDHGYQNATTIENSVDPRLWRDDVCLINELDKSSKLNILYMGSRTHQGDLEFLVSVLDELELSRPNTFQLTVIGIAPELPERLWLKIRTPEEEDTEYPRFARWMSRQAGQYDVGVAPLLQSKFNDLKSDLKVLEYTALGLQTLASNSVSYAQSPLTTLCDSKDDWLSALKSLIDGKVAPDTQSSNINENQKRLWNSRSSDIVAAKQLNQINKILSR